LKDSTLEVIRRMIELSGRGFEMFNESARRKRDDEVWRDIYEGLASIFEGYALCFARTKRRKFENHALRDIGVLL